MDLIQTDINIIRHAHTNKLLITCSKFMNKPSINVAVAFYKQYKHYYAYFQF